MICPDCKGKKVIELALSSVPCEMCRGTGEVPDGSPATPQVAIDEDPFWKYREPAQVFDPEALPRHFVHRDDPNADFCFERGKIKPYAEVFGAQTEKKSRYLSAINQFFDSRLGVPHSPKDGREYLRVAQDHDRALPKNQVPGHLYYSRPGDTDWYIGADLVCQIDGYSINEGWADLVIPESIGLDRICRFELHTPQRRSCLTLIRMCPLQLFRFVPIQVECGWSIAVEVVSENRVHRVGKPVNSQMSSNNPSFQNLRKHINFQLQEIREQEANE